MPCVVRKIWLFVLVLSIGAGSFAQNQKQAKAWFDAGEYERAKDAYKRIVSNNPRHGSYNYWYGVCLYETGEKDASVPYLKIAAEREVAKAFRYLGNYYREKGDYETAIENYETYVDEIKPTDSLYVKHVRLVEQMKKEMKYLKRVEKVLIVDSVVMPKKQFLKAYPVNQDNGLITSSTKLLKDCKTEGCMAYQTERKDKIYYSDVDADGSLQLFMRYKMLDEWSKPLPLEGLPEGDNNYPFMLSDGMTIYFANNGTSSLGGYDIYVTRYNSELDRYLSAENVGMPFNSSANDYMMAIDEINNLGWFATDRFQAEDSVCVYTFIPTEKKQYYDWDNDDRGLVLDAARLNSIALTQTDSEAFRKARQALLMLAINNSQTEEQKDFVFVIDDFTEYHRLTDFRSEMAREMFVSWQKQQENLKRLQKELGELRMQYVRTTAVERKNMTDVLLEKERSCESLESSVMEMERNIRNEENNYLSNRNK